MNKKLIFKWASFIGDSEEFVGSYFDCKIAIDCVPTKTSLKEIVEAIKPLEKLTNIKVTLGKDYRRVFISGLTAPIKLTTSFDVGDYSNRYSVVDKGPSVQWLLDNKEALSTTDFSEVLYCKDMAIQITSHKYDTNTVDITILNIEDMEYFLDLIEDDTIEWLGNTSFNTFLKSYGYIDEAINKDITAILMVYQAARELDFKDPKAIVTHFYDNRLIADLTLRGVFGNLKPCWYE